MESDGDGDGAKESQTLNGRDLLSSVKFNGFAEQAFDRLHERTLFHVLYAAEYRYKQILAGDVYNLKKNSLSRIYT